jgi:hypothetical protein
MKLQFGVNDGPPAQKVLTVNIREIKLFWQQVFPELEDEPKPIEAVITDTK